MLSAEALKAFKAIYKREKGIELTDEEAVKEAINLLTLFDAIYRPIRKECNKDVSAVAA